MLSFKLRQISRVINLTLKLDPFSAQHLAAINGKSIAIVVKQTGIAFAVAGQTESLSLVPLTEELKTAVHCTLEAPPLTLLNLCISQDKSLLQSALVKLQGDVSVLHDFIKVMSKIEIDWEEHLSKISGDVFAHQFATILQRSRAKQRQLCHTVASNFSEYLQEEANLITPAAALNAYYKDIDELRLTTDRLEARLHRLQTTLSSLHEPLC